MIQYLQRSSTTITARQPCSSSIGKLQALGHRLEFRGSGQPRVSLSPVLARLGVNPYGIGARGVESRLHALSSSSLAIIQRCCPDVEICCKVMYCVLANG